MKKLVALSLVSLLLTAACGDDDDDVATDGGSVDARTSDGGGADAASTNVYVPFSASNLVAQQARVGLFEELVALRKSAGFDRTKCGTLSDPRAGTLAEIYTRNDATAGVLMNSVRGRKDDHSYNLDATIGLQMHANIDVALTACDGGAQEAAAAAQVVEKNLVWFFYASVYHELHLGKAGSSDSPAKWDEAFGYYGRSADGLTSRGYASTAKSRDTQFNLTLNDTIFRGLIDGRNQIAANDYAAVAQTAARIDQNLLLVGAYAVARYFTVLPTMPTRATLHEGATFFNVIEPYMKSVDPTAAAYVRSALDNARFPYTNDPANIDAAGIVSRIEAAFGIDVTP